jgi:hypothetical protein
MSSRGLHLLFFHASHPTDEELLACLDGELDGRSLVRVRAHLDACWNCRVRRDRFDRSIAAFVEMRLEEGSSRVGFPPSSTLAFSERLREIDAAASKRPWWQRFFIRSRAVASRVSRLSVAWRPSSARLSPARLAPLTVAVLTLVLIVLSIGREPRVSAQELLVRTAAAQEARLRPVAQPVIYQRLQVSRRPAGASAADTHQTWELWSDRTHGRYRERVGAFAPIEARPPAPAGAQSCASSSFSSSSSSPSAPAAPVRELESILCANGLPATQPLSAAAFRDWRARVRNASDQVQARALDDGREAMVLRTRVTDRDDAMRIQELELVVRTEDWHPLVQRVVVQADAGLVAYELRELSFEVVPLATVAPSFFDESYETARTEHAPTPAPAAPPVSDADLVAAHVQALSALHRLGALLGEPIEVVRGASRRIEVRGLAATAERKQAIAEAVSGIPLVTVDVRTIDEAVAARRHRPAAPAAAAPDLEATTAQTGTVPIQALLDAYLAAPPRGRSQAFATEVVSISRDAMRRAWALERLARFALALDPSSVRPSTRRTLEGVALELADGLREKLDALDQRVTPVISPVLGADAAAGEEAPSRDAARVEDWPRQALRAFERVRSADEATRQLFAESDAGALDIVSASRALLDSCRAGRRLAIELTERLAPPAGGDANAQPPR